MTTAPDTPTPAPSPTRQAVVLVGGRGTRLGALTEATPKPLLPIAGQPFLRYLVQGLARHGFTDIVLLSGYLSDAVDRFCADTALPGVRLRCVVESVPLGTGGALKHAAAELDTQFLLLNGDTLFDFNFNDLCLNDGATLARMALRHVPDTDRFGRVLTEGAKVTAMQEKGVVGPGHVNGGVYWMRRECLDLLPEGESSLERLLFPALIASGQLQARAYDGFFLDIGIPSDFEAAQTTIPANARKAAVFLDRDGVLNVDHHYIHRPDQVEWVDGAKAAVKAFNDAGCYVFVVTNQAGIARGFYTAEQLHALHAWMQDELRLAGAHIDRFYHCPHHPDFGSPCSCRKPEPGMLQQALAEWSVNVAASALIGDKPGDVEAAERVGVVGHLFAPGQNLRAFAAQHLPALTHPPTHPLTHSATHGPTHG